MKGASAFRPGPLGSGFDCQSADILTPGLFQKREKVILVVKIAGMHAAERKQDGIEVKMVKGLHMHKRPVTGDANMPNEALRLRFQDRFHGTAGSEYGGEGFDIIHAMKLEQGKITGPQPIQRALEAFPGRTLSLAWVLRPRKKSFLCCSFRNRCAIRPLRRRAQHQHG